MAFFSGVTVVSFCFAFVFMLSLKPRPFVQSSFAMQAPRLPHIYILYIYIYIYMCFFAFIFVFVYLDMSLFPSFFSAISVLSLYGEYVVRSFLPDGVFLPRINTWTPLRKSGGIPQVSTRFSLNMENEQADAGRDG